MFKNSQLNKDNSVTVHFDFTNKEFEIDLIAELTNNGFTQNVDYIIHTEYGDDVACAITIINRAISNHTAITNKINIIAYEDI